MKTTVILSLLLMILVSCKTHQFTEKDKNNIIQPDAEAYLNSDHVWEKKVIIKKMNLKDQVVGVKLIYTPSGSFLMGSEKSLKWSIMEKEFPQHKVTISKGFWLGKYEITQGQWESVMDDNPSFFKVGDQELPVEQVSWDECLVFIGKLNKSSRTKFRFPTEAEWEYACRAGTTTETYAGEVELEFPGLLNGGMLSADTRHSRSLDDISWYIGNSFVNHLLGLRIQENQNKKSSIQGSGTHRVGQKKPNPWGLYDMLGNVEEWCFDFYGGYFVDHQVNPSGPQRGSERVSRGGSWFHEVSHLRCASRGSHAQSHKWPPLGLRIAL